MGKPIPRRLVKAWDKHVTHALGITLEQNLEAVDDTVRYFKSLGREVILDAELAFAGFRHNADYAQMVLETAVKAEIGRAHV